MAYVKNSLAQSHVYIENLVKSGDIVVDATAGKGNDTLFLSKLVGNAGFVYSFDIQEKAHEATKDRLLNEGFFRFEETNIDFISHDISNHNIEANIIKTLEVERKNIFKHDYFGTVIQIHDGHENIQKHVHHAIKCVMFNLGYLPGGDHNIGTKWETTIKAIESSLELLVLHGLVCLVVYYGGDSGFDEKNQVLEFVKKLDCKKYTVMQTEFVNQMNCPPILVLIEKNL